MPPKFKRNVSGGDMKSSEDCERVNLLDNQSDDDEDFFLHGPNTKSRTMGGTLLGNGSTGDRLGQVRTQVDDVTNIMRENMTRVLERGDRLDDLQDRSESLIGDAENFRASSRRLQRKMWWNNTKMKLIIGGSICGILLIIFIPIIISHSRS